MAKDNHDHKHCQEWFEKLSEYIDGELDEFTCAEIEKHVKECLPCYVCLETLKRTIDLCKQTKNKRIPKAVSKKLQDLIQSYPKSTPV
ncbi:MAG: zf-HC2 domain-containing protein [Desulfobacterales bacterium]|nr:MAG: zf-HC2 domain-containing protein [Desulfobacterales bacterium]